MPWDSPGRVPLGSHANTIQRQRGSSSTNSVVSRASDGDGASLLPSRVARRTEEADASWKRQARQSLMGKGSTEEFSTCTATAHRAKNRKKQEESIVDFRLKYFLYEKYYARTRHTILNPRSCYDCRRHQQSGPKGDFCSLHPIGPASKLPITTTMGSNLPRARRGSSSRRHTPGPTTPTQSAIR